MIASRIEIERAFVKVLTDSGVPNVRLSVERKEKKYPMVVFDMTSENQDHPLLSSDITVDATIMSLIADPATVTQEHYDLTDKVRFELSPQARIYNKLLGAGLRVGWVYSTTDTGLEIDSGEAGPMAISTVQVSLSVQ